MDNSKLIQKIQQLKRKRNAVILVHNYQIGEVQDIADYIGDSLGLSRDASKTNADVIVFCGVRFMAETAKILSPDKKVLIPEINAGCPMADMITVKELRKLKKEHPQAVVVAYVNTTAEVKAEVDICCTSANALGIVNSIPKDKEIIFVPDKYLAHYVSTQTNRRLIPWEGYCLVHVKILPEDIIKQKEQYPQAEVIVHPECTPEVIKLADRTLSTSGICRYAKGAETSEMNIGTEIGILHRLRKENPQKRFYPASKLAVCSNMKLITLERVLWALEDLQYEIRIPDNIRIRAKQTVERMLQIKSHTNT